MNFLRSLAALLVLAAAGFGLLLPVPDGPFVVHWDSFELVDNARPDPFNTSHPRRMMVSRFSPISQARCEKTCHVPYMPPDIAVIEEEILDSYFGAGVWPSGLLGSLELEVCCMEFKERNHELERKLHNFPTLLFGPGLNTTRLSYSGMAQHLASKGYEVIVMDHPYETDVVKFPDGNVIFGGNVAFDPTNPNDTSSLEFGLGVRTKDVSFVLDTLNIRKTTYMGHSFGGASAAASILNETRIVSGVNVDGALWGSVVSLGISQPFLSWGSTGHNSSTDPSWTGFFNAMDVNHDGVWTKELNVENSTHSSFMDYSLIGAIADFKNDETLGAFVGEISAKRMMEILKRYLSDFIEFTLEHGDEGLLAGPSEDYPEVRFLR